MVVQLWGVGNDRFHGLGMKIFNERMVVDIPKASSKFHAKRSIIYADTNTFLYDPGSANHDL